MKVFLLSCLAAVVIMVGAYFVLHAAIPLSSQQAYTTGDNVRVGEADTVTSDTE